MVVTSRRHVINSRGWHSARERTTTTANDRTNDMNEPKKTNPTTQVVHEEATATNISYSQPPAEPVVISISPLLQAPTNGHTGRNNLGSTTRGSQYHS